MSTIEAITAVIILNALPVVEQTGGIPTGIALGLSPIETLLISLLVNIMIFAPIYFGMNIIYKLLSRIGYLERIFTKYVEGARRKAKPYVEKYGMIGMALFVALPGPLTGTYTASLASWALELNWRKAWFAIGIGSIISGVLVLLAAMGIFTTLHAVGY
jgi:uncharacterized membrane protein